MPKIGTTTDAGRHAIKDSKGSRGATGGKNVHSTARRKSPAGLIGRLKGMFSKTHSSGGPGLNV